MGDPWVVVPYHDPHDVSPLYSIQQHLLEDQNPTLSDLYYPVPSNPNPNSSPCPSSDYSGRIPPLGKGTRSRDPASNSLHDTLGPGTGSGSSSYTYAQCDPTGPGGSNGEAGPSSYAENLIVKNAKPLSIWPEPPSPYSCSCCHLLREMVHSNGTHTTRLELHGRVGMICHAILENRFCKRGIEDVKQFLKQYCEERSQAGYVLLPDPLSKYYEAVCIGLVWDDSIFADANDYFEYSAGISEEAPNEQPEDAPPANQQTEPMQNNQAPNEPPEDAPPTDQQMEPEQNSQDGTNSRTFLAIQRERTGRLTLRDLAGYFHLPVEAAARKLNLCPTVVKRICRRGGLKRWPHRKIKSIERQISKLQLMLASKNREDKLFAQNEVERLQNQIAIIRYGVPEAP
ncbi:hypothetical protein CDL15_Pgr022082 [Punica granatum]|uniref:RWP-RK domain-containing protein n=1 Tax=Punica granatum TaxID=22663 RepID=A0A218VS33_PUNGR|nr:hypothetical protein CDL15_Pgr022082 [Punica granatum]